MVVNSVLPSLLNLAQIVTILNTTVASTPFETTTTVHYYLNSNRDRDVNLYGRRESSESLIGN